jgi:probable phosphoglycerate mutase
LSARARAQLAALCAPAALDGFVWLTSPLGRAQETARLLAPSGPITVEPALIESRWGAWEGETLDGLRARLGAGFTDIERRGLDFLPPGGESPRMVQQRLRPWLARLGATRQPVVAVTHKGVIRAVLGLATGWDFLGKPPARLDWSMAHLFAIDATGHPAIHHLNLPLASR